MKLSLAILLLGIFTISPTYSFTHAPGYPGRSMSRKIVITDAGPQVHECWSSEGTTGRRENCYRIDPNIYEKKVRYIKVKKGATGKDFMRLQR